MAVQTSDKKYAPGNSCCKRDFTETESPRCAESDSDFET